jgi:CheY-like chemotaxis protein
MDEHKDKLFKPFNQIDPEIIQNGGGSGLGLSISKHIVELHEGTIGFTSELNKGSHFYFNIPKKFSKTEDLGNIESSTVNIPKKSIENEIVLPKIPNKQQVNNHKILIAEDNIVIQKLFKKLLLSLGNYEIEIAENGLEAVNKYKNSYNNKNCYTIIFMDQEMPEMDGCLAARKIKEINKNAVIIGITGNVSQLDINKFLNHGALEVYKKPITKIEVIELLQKYKF